MARAAWWATVHGVAKSQTRLKRLSTQGPNVLSVANIVCACFGASPVAQLVKNLPAMRETWVRFLGWEDPLEKGKATHSSILAWRIPGTGQPGGLPSMGSHRVGHN